MNVVLAHAPHLVILKCVICGFFRERGEASVQITELDVSKVLIRQ